MKWRVSLSVIAACALASWQDVPSACATDDTALQIERAVQLGQPRATLTKLDTLPCVENEFTRRFKFESFDNVKLLELRERYRLEEVVAAGKDEFDRQVLLLDWVHNRFKKFGWPSTKTQGALEILQAIDDGHTFFCAQFAELFVSASASLGWVDRHLALRRPDNMGEGSTEHSSTEIWSNQYKKWIMFDPTYALYVEKNGLPLNAYELRREWFYKDGADLVFVIGKDRQRFRKSDMPVLRRQFAGYGDLALIPKSIHVYAFIGYIPNTNVMDDGLDYVNMFITQDRICEGTTWHRRTVPKDPAVDPYFPIGQAALTLRPTGSDLRVKICTLTPNLDRFLARKDGGAWQPVDAVFTWNLHEGANRLEARTVNKFGVEGPISLAIVDVETARAEAGIGSRDAASAPAVATEPIRTVTIGDHRELRVNDKPFFPLMSWVQSPRRYSLLRSLGFNTFCGGDAKECCDAAKAAGGYAMPGFDESAQGHPALLAWTEGDEPDLGYHNGGKPRKTAESVVEAYGKLRERDASRPVFLNLTSGFMTDGKADKQAAEKRAYYTTVVNGCDIASFDIYPIYGYNLEDKLIWVADGVKQLRDYAGPKKPVFACIETSKGSRWVTYERQKDVRPEHTRAEVWMAIIRGATGIMYFTHAWRPAFTEFAPQQEMQQELKRLNEQITRLAPAILSAPANVEASISIAGDLAGEIMAREHNGQLYLFANNLDMEGKAGQATLKIAGLQKGAKIEVLDEGRSLIADHEAFADQFDPLAVHLYRVEKSSVLSPLSRQ